MPTKAELEQKVKDMKVDYKELAKYTTDLEKGLAGSNKHVKGLKEEIKIKSKYIQDLRDIQSNLNKTNFELLSDNNFLKRTVELINKLVEKI